MNNGAAFEKIKAYKYDLLGRPQTEIEDRCDDIKAIAGQLYLKLKDVLGLRESGSTTVHFAIHTLAPLITLDTEAYRVLHEDLFA